MMRHTAKSFLLVFILLIAFSAQSIAQDDLTEERMLLTYIPNVQFAPFYVGIDGGYFADAGLSISIEHLQEPEVVDLIAAGQSNFGIVSGEQVILARSQGRDVVYVYEWFQDYPVGIVVSADSGVTTMKDLAGKKVGIAGRYGASYSGLTTLLQASGMTESDIQIEEIGFNAPEVFCLGAVDAAIIYVNNEPLQIRDRAQAGECGDVQDVSVITVSSMVDLVSNGLITSANFLAENPDEVQAMVDGLDAALLDTINNPARAYLISINYVENLPAGDDFVAALQTLSDEQDTFLADEPSREDIAASRQTMMDTLAEEFDADTLTQFGVLLTSIDLWDAEVLGNSDLESWVSMQETLVSMGALVEGEIDLSAAFTNQFVETES